MPKLPGSAHNQTHDQHINVKILHLIYIIDLFLQVINKKQMNNILVFFKKITTYVSIATVIHVFLGFYGRENI